MIGYVDTAMGVGLPLRLLDLFVSIVRECPYV